MYPSEWYAVYSLELHLFFARIMKEHALFLMAASTPATPAFTKAAEELKQEFEALLSRAVAISDGVVGQKALRSGEFFTPFTLVAEQQTERFTGIDINRDITMQEKNLRPGMQASHSPQLVRQVQTLNRTALRLLGALISLKEQILSHVLNCQMFTMNYPLLLEHIIREAKLYREYVYRLETDGDLDPQEMGELEQFWNQIMMEHALFIRGLLDPSENELIHTADSFAADYANLLKQSRLAQDRTLTESALTETKKFRDFKMAGVKGIETCEIRSVILPLLADHVLREANHYLRLLGD
ncbi:DUF2935 domain-containing protein [Oscillibacter sp.]|uniref:DUF2935 domain-containing protein n=1 Tax=Oscillibacter sp. TaxID=1945593 RepID=UPI0026346E1B|nr:DUF2935 domain-containing protein [Oscillibacter sp.]MDD3347569.1 DUF2935 domain-containing protein [Oscillibacter sp.]